MAVNKVNSGLLEFSEDQKVFVALDAETSEVKKAVTIDEDGVETDMLGVQPTGKKEITSTAEVNVANYATAQVVDEDLVAGNIKKDVDILGVVGNYEPAAPASDFSTAEVTVSDTTGTPPVLMFSRELSMNDGGTDFKISFPTAKGSGTYTAILYYGQASLVIDNSNRYTIAVSGNIEDTGDGTYIITGDCTITISTPTPA